MTDITTKDLLAKIGALVVENDALRTRLARIEAALAARPIQGSDNG